MTLKETEEMWFKLKAQFLQSEEVQNQGESLKIRRKMFAMLSKGKFTLKLPKERVTLLLENNVGVPYDPGNGKIMKEWIIIPVESREQWMELAEEAKKFALSLAK